MFGQLFIDSVTNVVEYVDQRYGRVAAWIAASLLLTVGFGAIIALSIWVIFTFL